MDYNKYRYERQKKEKDALKKQRASQAELKEFRLSPVIDVGDFETKLRNAIKYLKKGDKVKLSIRFKGRQMAHTELGKEVLDRFAEQASEYAEVAEQAKLDGRNMTMMLVPKKISRRNKIMPKIKTHKGTAKVIKKRKNDIKIGRPGSRHNTGYKPTSANRKNRKGSNLSKADQNRLKNVL